jgi:PIN domain nuclease of toxin-antitoxin system
VILLDTHVLFWWATKDTVRLTAAARAAISEELPDGEILVSSITAWEIALLAGRRRLNLALDVAKWLSTFGEISEFRFIPVDNEIGIEAVNLPGEFHKDPADRIIVATARKFGAPIITADEKIRAYRHVRTIW